MEARSLASLNFLAANPPQYPVNPSEERQDPLTLYISRVPGTRDVILSPFKPQLKNVTGEDVASSLYYVHLDTSASDAHDRPSFRHDPHQNRSSDEGSPSRRAIPRKPIPGNGNGYGNGNGDGNGITAHQSSESTLRAPQPGPAQGHLSPRSSMDYQPSPVMGRPSLQNYPSGSTADSRVPVGDAPPQLPPHSPVSPMPLLNDTLPPLPPRYSTVVPGPVVDDAFPPPPPPRHQTAVNPIPVVQDAPPPPPPHQTGVPARKPVMDPRIANPTAPIMPPVGAHDRSLPPVPREPYTSNERGYNFEYSSPASRRSTGRGSYLEFEEARGEAPPPSLLYPDDSQRIARHVYETDYPVQAPPAGRTSPNRFTRSPSPTQAPKQKETFTLSIIRRDPSTGNQWNIGRVTSEQVAGSRRSSGGDEGSLPVVSSSARPPIDVRIETSGYAKFRHMPSRRSMDTSGSNAAAAAAAAAAMFRETTPPNGDDAGFTRQVQMAYSKSWTSNLKEKWNRMEKNSIAARQGHSRNHSAVSVSSVASASTSPPPVTTIGQPGPGMKPRGYVFTSPWDGRCDFRTGNAGRSLRCHHNLHEGQSSAYNPLVAEQQQQELGLASTTGPSTVVSELRFNLPSSELLAPDDPDKRGRAHQRLGSLGKLWKREGDDDDGEVSPFDLNVGRERAGGGNRGSRAKLGKLIIYNDGLKMLDLIVAANIGVWWGTWERSF